MVRATIAVAFMVLFMAAPLVSAGIAISWTDCGSAANKVKIDKITWVPANPVAGDTVNITATGTLSEGITSMPEDLVFAGIFHNKFEGAYCSVCGNAARALSRPQCSPRRTPPRARVCLCQNGG